MPDEVLAVVLIGDGPYDLAPLGGVPSVVRAVRALLGVAGEVALAGSWSLVDDALRLCADLPVVRAAPVGTPVAGGIVVLHEAARPLAPPALADAVLGAVRAGAAAAVPVLPLTDTVKRLGRTGDLHGAADRATLRVVQSPVAFRAAGSLTSGLSPSGSLPSGLSLSGSLPSGPLDLVGRCTNAGVAVHAVPGHPAALALRSPWDVERAGLLLEEMAG